MKRWLASTSVAVLALGALVLTDRAPARAQEPAAPPTVLVQVGKPGERAAPVALPLPKGDTAASRELWDVVKRDLELTGWFKIVAPEATIEPASAGVRPGEFDFAHWRPLGVAALAKTRLVQDGANLRAEAWVYGVDGGELLGEKAFSAPAGSVRALGHKVADAILFLVTGEHGFFDTRFTFAGSFTGNKEIWVCDADGGNLRQVTRNGSINLKPRWRPDGGAIAWTGYAAGNPDLYVADLGAKAIKRVSARAGLNTGGAFAPGGGALALTLSVGSDAEIFTTDAGGRSPTRLTKSPGIDSSPSWSPDGRQVAFVSERSGSPQIYVMNADGSNPRRVTFQGAHNTDPAWSPRGDRIAFVGRDGTFDVFTVGVDGRGMQRVTQGQGDNEDPSWSPDGRYLAFSSTRAGGAHIWVASEDGSFQVKVTQGKGGYTNPHWGPSR